MWKSCVLASSLLILFSCQRWNDQDLYIPEVFINDNQSAFVIVKNQGHDKILQQGIKLRVNWDDSLQFVFLLDTMDPHFRYPRDSSIIKLPISVSRGVHRVFAHIDADQVLTESIEDQNYYSKTLISGSDTGAISFHSPIASKFFPEDIYLEKMQTIPFANRVVWYEGNQPFILSFWQANWKKDLLEHIRLYYQDSNWTIKDTLSDEVTRETAFDIYLNYIAHALVLDHEKIVPWQVSNFKSEDIGLLWDSRNYFSYDSVRHVYHWSYESGGGVKGLNPIPILSFAQALNTDFTSPGKAIDQFLKWTRAYLNHTETMSKIQFQDPVSVFFPMSGNVHRTESCWATSGLLLEYSRALNIPIFKSSIPLHNGIHAQISFPTENIYLSHADDIYDPLFYPIGNDMPLNKLYLNSKEYTDFMSKKIKCLGDSCHTTGSQHTYDRRRYLITKAWQAKSGVLIRAASDNELKSILRGDEFPQMLAPFFTDTESKQIEASLKQEKSNISMINTLYQRYIRAKNNTR